MSQVGSSQRWWYVQAGTTKGPVEWAEIVSLVDAGTLDTASRVMAVGTDEWRTVAQHLADPKGARPEEPTVSPAPPPGATLSDRAAGAVTSGKRVVSAEARAPAVLRDFTAFLLRGNVVDLAVAVVIGVAFAAVVNALVKDILTPIIAIPGSADFSSLAFTINGSRFAYGDFLNAVISFVAIAASVFFFVVRPVNTLMARRKTAPEVRSETRECPECLSSIPVGARRCAFCTAKVAPATKA